MCNILLCASAVLFLVPLALNCQCLTISFDKILMDICSIDGYSRDSVYLATKNLYWDLRLLVKL